VYTHELASGYCGDGSNVDLKIAFQSSKSILLRESCVNLKPVDQKEVAVLLDPSDKTFVVYNNIQLGAVPAAACVVSNVTAPAPVIDMQAANFPGSGDEWKNSGSGGWIYDMWRGTPADLTSYPTYVAAAPAHWLFDGSDHLFARYGATTFTKTLHHKGAKYTIVYEGYMSSGKLVAIVSNGAWHNLSGVAFNYGDSQVSLIVGNGSSNESLNCNQAANSLCASGPVIGPSGVPQNLFGAVSIDEASGVGYLQTNQAIQQINATYSKDTTTDNVHELDIGGIWEAKQDAGSTLYRMRIWDSALSENQLKALYNQSSGACPW
jgi:hypothetical protein